MALGTASSPAIQVTDGESETNSAVVPPSVSVVESASSVTNAVSLPVGKSIHNYSNRRRPSRQFRPAPFFPSPSPYPAVHPIPPSPYFEFYVPGVLPRPFNFVNKPLPPPPPIGPATEWFLSLPDPELINKIVTQVDYYFSVDNLITDTYLRQKMDDDGWVSIPLIANFNRMKRLTNSVPLIIYALGTSSRVVEVWGDQVRRRDDWKRWILPATLFPSGGKEPY